MPKVVAAKTPEHFLVLLEKSQLFSADQLAEARVLAHDHDDPKAVARQLVRKDYLTSWQAGQILGGWHNLVVGNYCLMDQISKSALGRTFVALHRKLERQVQFLAVARSKLKNDELMGRVIQSAQNASALNHTHLLHLLDVERDEDRCFVVFEHVQGRDLQSIVDSQGQLEPSVIGGYLQQATAGLVHAHENGVVHGNLTSKDLLVDSSGQIKVKGIGISRFELNAEDELPDIAADASDDVSAISNIGLKLVDADDSSSEELVELLRHGATGELTMQQLSRLVQRWLQEHCGGEDEFSAPALNMEDEKEIEKGAANASPFALAPVEQRPPKRPSRKKQKERAESEQPESVEPKQSSVSVPQIVGIASAVVIVILGGLIWFIFFGPKGENKTPVAKRRPNQTAQKRDPQSDPESDPESNDSARSKQSPIVGGGFGLGPVFGKKKANKKSQPGPKQPGAGAVGQQTITNVTAEKKKKQPAPIPPQAKKKQTKKKAAGKSPTAKKKPPVAAKKKDTKKKQPAKKKAPPPKPKPVRIFQLPTVIQLPKTDAPQLSLGRIDIKKGDLLFVKLSGGQEAVRGESTKIEMDQKQEGTWDIFLTTKQKKTPIAKFFIQGKNFLFRWLPIAAKERYAYHLCNCVISLSARQQTQEIVLRKSITVNALIVNLDRANSNTKWQIEHLPDPGQIRIETGKIVGKFPKHRWEIKVFRASKGRNILWLGNTKDKEPLGIRLESKASRFVQLSMMAQLREPGSRGMRRFSTREANAWLNNSRFRSNALTQQIAAAGVPEARKVLLRNQKKLVDANIAQLQQLSETYKMINRKAELHFRIVHMVGIKRYPLAVTIKPKVDPPKRRRGRTPKGKKRKSKKAVRAKK